MKQRTEEWHKARQGIPTASQFHRVTLARDKSDWIGCLLPKYTKHTPRFVDDLDANGRMNYFPLYFSDTAASYALEILAYEITGERIEIDAAATRWGNDHEPIALAWYEGIKMQQVHDAPFVAYTLPDGSRTGASPDGYTGPGIVEAKCPHLSHNHIRTLVTGVVPKDYMPQVQGELMATGAEWCDFISFDPRAGKHKMKVIRVLPDKEYIQDLELRLMAFNDMLNKMREKL